MKCTDLSPQAKKIVDKFIQDRITQPDTFNSTIHEKDEMYLYILQHSFSNGNKDCAYFHYLQNGEQMIDAVRQIIKWGFGSFNNLSSFLDFACGYGRFMRFLTQELPVERIRASDINADAVRIQVEQFGISGIVSVLIPEDHRDNNVYDCIFVASLFSHLPEKTFIGWLKRLYNMLTPEGLLIFSVHDVDIMPPNLHMSDNGIIFIESESSPLNKSYYGTTYVTESFVRNVINTTSGQKDSYCRIVKGLSGFQDIYVISRNPKRNFSTLDFHLGLQGYLDTCTLNDNGEVCFNGWAADFSKNPSGIKDVQIIVNGPTVKHCLPNYERPDVAEHFKDERGYNSGWLCCLQKDSIAPTDFVIVKITSYSNSELILRIGTLESMLK